MGKRGPAATPTSILEARGSWRAKVREREPECDATLPAAPRWLDDSGKAVYRQVAADLRAMGIGKKPDVNALVRYARLWVRWKQADEFLQKYGDSYPLKAFDKNGCEKIKCFMPFPQVSIVNKLSVLLLRLEQEFGLTPSARTNIKVDISAPKQEQQFASKIVG